MKITLTIDGKKKEFKKLEHLQSHVMGLSIYTGDTLYVMDQYTMLSASDKKTVHRVIGALLAQ